MEDERIHSRIEELVAEEHELYERRSGGDLDEADHNRLESIRVSLDQCWDLLRQRRALREAGYGSRTRSRSRGRRALRAVGVEAALACGTR
jgi:hypothetical protein